MLLPAAMLMSLADAITLRRLRDAAIMPLLAGIIADSCRFSCREAPAEIHYFRYCHFRYFAAASADAAISLPDAAAIFR